MRSIKLPPKSNQVGFIMLLFLLLMIVLLSSAGLALDISRASLEQQRIQIAADAASLAAVGALGASADYSKVITVVKSIGSANSVSTGEITLTPPRCGVWKNNSFVPQSSQTCDTTSTAVEVTVNRSLPLSFGRIITDRDIQLVAQSVSHISSSSRNCIRPFGIEMSYLSLRRPSIGDSVVVQGDQNSGNWGKIDLYGNSSSGHAYTDYMINNVCDDSIETGSTVSVGTGAADIRQVFATLLSNGSAASNMVLAVTSDFGPGNGTVTILGFIRADLISQRGNGSNWSATLRIVELAAEPDPPASSLERQLMQ